MTYNDSHVSCVFITLHETGGTDMERQHTLNQSTRRHNRHVDVFRLPWFQLEKNNQNLAECEHAYVCVCVFMCLCCMVPLHIVCVQVCELWYSKFVLDSHTD